MLTLRTYTQRDRGFTILEVLISVVIIALVMTIVYTAFTAGSRACQHGSERAQIFHTARVAMQDIIQAIENMEYGQTNYLSFIGEEGSALASGESVGDDTLTFATYTQPTLINGRWQAGRARVQYRINRDAEPLTPAMKGKPAVALEKLVSRVNDEELDDAYALEISRDVVGLSFRYYDEDSFDRNWDSEIEDHPPEFVEITLFVREGENIHLLRSGALIPHMTLSSRSSGTSSGGSSENSSAPPERTAPDPDTPVQQPRTDTR